MYDVAFSTDSQHVFSASFDQTVKQWSTTGVLVKTFAGHTDFVYCVQVSRDGRHIASSTD